MSPETARMLEDWLINGTDQQKTHAHRSLNGSHAYPPLLEQAANAAGALVRAAASGFARVSQEEADRRLAICRGDGTQPKCKFYDSSQGRCSSCACVAAWKARLVSEHCPLDPPRW
jgi:hypothetical protein